MQYTRFQDHCSPNLLYCNAYLYIGILFAFAILQRVSQCFLSTSRPKYIAVGIFLDNLMTTFILTFTSNSGGSCLNIFMEIMSILHQFNAICIKNLITQHYYFIFENVLIHPCQLIHRCLHNHNIKKIESFERASVINRIYCAIYQSTVLASSLCRSSISVRSLTYSLSFPLEFVQTVIDSIV